MVKWAILAGRQRHTGRAKAPRYKHRGAPISLVLLLALVAAALLARGLAVIPLVGVFRAATALIGGLGRRYAHRRRPWRHLHAL